MRSMLLAFVALAMTMAMSSGFAVAAQTEGKITKIDADAQTVTLDDGKSYKVPGEFDVTTLTEGSEIIIAYDVVNGQNLITDMQIDE